MKKQINGSNVFFYESEFYKDKLNHLFIEMINNILLLFNLKNCGLINMSWLRKVDWKIEN